MRHPADVGFETIEKVIKAGSKKDGCNEDWRHKGKLFHLMKAIRHATTAAMIEEGIIKPDGENHAELAITRLAMSLTD